MRVPASLRPLRHRRFALVFTAAMVSNVGSWMETVAVASLVRASTGQDTWTAFAALAAFLPLGVLTPVGGALADRMERRRFLIVASLVEAAIAGVLAVLTFTGEDRPGFVIALVGLGGCVTALRLPFQQAVLPDLVPGDELLAATALGAAQYNFGRVIGPALAAAVIALAGFGAAFAVNAASFLAVTAALVPLRFPAPRHDGTTLWRGIRDGARVARSVPSVRVATLTIAVVAVLISPFIALVASRAAELTEGGARDVARTTGVLTTAQGIGAVLGALVLPTVADRVGRPKVVLGCILVSCASVTVYSVTPDVLTTAAAMIVLGAAYIGVLAGLQTVVQIAAPAAYRGRVLSLFFVGLGTLYPIGALVHGAISDRSSLAVPMVGGAAILGALVLVAATQRRFVAALEPDPADAVDTSRRETASSIDPKEVSDGRQPHS